MAALRIKLLAGTALTLAGAMGAHSALADTAVGWYVAADAGQTPRTTQSLDISDVTLTSTATAGTTAPLAAASSLKIDYGAAGLLRGGYRFTRNLRAEVELGTRPAKITEGLAGEQTPGIGSVDKSSAMFNLIYDIGPDWGVHPFIGVGAGVVQAKTSYNGTATSGGHTRTFTITSSQSVPASQVLAGASWYIADHLRFDMTYRYLRTGSKTYNVGISDKYTLAANTVTDTYTAKAKGDFNSQTLTVGLRYTFGASPRAPIADSSYTPPPPPAPKVTKTKAEGGMTERAPLWGLWPFGAKPAKTTVAKTDATPVSPAAAPSSAVSVTDTMPPAAPAAPAAPEATPVAMNAGDQAPAAGQPPVTAIPDTREFTVYFPFNSARLNSAAQGVVSEAAQYAKQAPAPKVAVTGYTDTSGSAAYNLILSKRRAKAVASGLKAEGVPGDAITVSGKGETDLAVQTRNGVAKSANRRTVIEVSF
jgi:outer membrane protein OmpA-like peptidoglycan-associated protein/opacity protein-like surface antigen